MQNGSHHYKRAGSGADDRQPQVFELQVFGFQRVADFGNKNFRLSEVHLFLKQVYGSAVFA